MSRSRSAMRPSWDGTRAQPTSRSLRTCSKLDSRAANREHRLVLLLGDPGSGHAVRSVHSCAARRRRGPGEKPQVVGVLARYPAADCGHRHYRRTRTPSPRSSMPCSPRVTSAPSTNTSPRISSITTRPWAGPPTGRACVLPGPCSGPRSPTGTATWTSSSKRAIWSSRPSRRAARSTGEIFGVPASGRTVSLPGINIWRVRDGRIVERWGRDELGLMRQLGLAPSPDRTIGKCPVLGDRNVLPAHAWAGDHEGKGNAIALPGVSSMLCRTRS